MRKRVGVGDMRRGGGRVRRRGCGSREEWGMRGGEGGLEEDKAADMRRRGSDWMTGSYVRSALRNVV
jgi:hypothetical protein